MLADARRCSYFELGLPVLFPAHNSEHVCVKHAGSRVSYRFQIDSSYTWGRAKTMRKRYEWTRIFWQTEEKSCAFKRIRIRVDSASFRYVEGDRGREPGRTGGGRGTGHGRLWPPCLPTGMGRRKMISSTASFCAHSCAVRKDVTWRIFAHVASSYEHFFGAKASVYTRKRFNDLFETPTKLKAPVSMIRRTWRHVNKQHVHTQHLQKLLCAWPAPFSRHAYLISREGISIKMQIEFNRAQLQNFDKHSNFVQSYLSNSLLETTNLSMWRDEFRLKHFTLWHSDHRDFADSKVSFLNTVFA